MEELNRRNVPDYLYPYFSRRTQIQHYVEYEKHIKKIRNLENIFICLKGFSSSTPFFRSSSFNTASFGGGFFFRWNGFGIAVDPGIGFLTLMHKHNIFIDDIDAVIVTHAHIDHNQDVRGISSLLYDYNKGRGRGVKFYSELIPDFFQSSSHSIHWVLDSTTFDQIKEDINGQKVSLLKDVYSNGGIELSEDIKLMSFFTEHVKEDSFGIKLSFDDKGEKYVWGYTSDTRYFDALHQHLSGCNVIIMNVSDVYVKDIKGIKGKPGHLGFDGCYKLIEELRPKISLISEFTCMNGDFRYEIVKGLTEALNLTETRILPAEVGMTFSLVGKGIRCSYCKCIKPVSHIKAIRPREYFSDFRYVCTDCML